MRWIEGMFPAAVIALIGLGAPAPTQQPEVVTAVLYKWPTAPAAGALDGLRRAKADPAKPHMQRVTAGTVRFDVTNASPENTYDVAIARVVGAPPQPGADAALSELAAMADVPPGGRWVVELELDPGTYMLFGGPAAGSPGMSAMVVAE